MHELSVAQNIVEIVEQYVPAHERQNVRSVRVRVGDLSGVVRDSLEFCFSAATAGTPLASAHLQTERVAFKLHCDACGEERETEAGLALCPACGSFSTRVIAGNELHVVDIELAEEGVERS